MTSVAARPFRAIDQEPATMPSTRNVAAIWRLRELMRARCSSAMTRLRSWWPMTTLSQSGTNRTAAGVSAAGRGASDTSKSSRLRSSRKVLSSARMASNTGPSFGNPDQVCASATDAGPKAAR
jgi:hypothetical protein